MIPLALALALPLVQDPAPVAGDARFHPARSTFYVAFPDLPAATEAYGSVPLSSWLAEPAVASWTQELEERSGLVPELADGPAAWLTWAWPELVPWTGDLRSASFSAARAGEEGFPGVLALFELGSEERAEALVTALRATVDEPIPLSGAFEGAQALSLEGMSFPVWTARRGTRVWIGGGAVSPNDAAALAAGEADGLDDDPTFAAALAGFARAERTVDAELLVFVQKEPAHTLLRDLDREAGILLGRVAPHAYPLFAPIDPLADPRVTRLAIQDGRFLNETFRPADAIAPRLIQVADATAATKAVDSVTLTRVQLERAAPGAFLTLVSAELDGAKIGRSLSGALAQLAGESPDAFAPLTRALEPLGPRATLSVFPLAGLGLPKVIGWLQAEDAEGIAASVQESLDELGRSYDGFETRTRNYTVRNRETDEARTFPLTTISLPQGWWSMLPIASASPSFTVLDGELLFALQPTHLKRELKRAFGGRGTTAEPSPFEAAGVEVPKDASSVVLVDWRVQAHSLLDAADLLLLFARDWLPIDLDELPDLREPAGSLEPTFIVSKRTAGGTTTVSRDLFGPEGWFALAWALEHPELLAPDALLGARESEDDEGGPRAQ